MVLKVGSGHVGSVLGPILLNFFSYKLRIFVISWSVRSLQVFSEAVFLVVCDPSMNEL
jgi:hypothetical protein